MRSQAKIHLYQLLWQYQDFLLLWKVGANDQQKLLSWLDKLGVHMSDQTFAMQHNLSHQSQWNTIRQARWQANVSHNANCHKGVQLTISMVTLTANSKWNSVYKQLTMYLIAISCDVIGLPIVASHAVMSDAHLHIFHICKFAQLHIYTIAQLNIYTIAQIAGEKKQSRSSQQPSLPLSLDHSKLFCLSHSFIFGNLSHSLILFVASIPLLWVEFTGECPLIGSGHYFHFFYNFTFAFH